MTTASVKDFDDNTHVLNVGDLVCFKCDIEQQARIVKISGHGFNAVMTVEAPLDGFEGAYIRNERTATVYADDAWI